MNNSLRILWLDDIRDPFDPNLRWVHDTMCVEKFNPGDTIVWCRTYDTFVDEVKDQMPDVVCFDHDLGDGKTGYDAAKWLIDYCLETGKLPPKVYSQSSNPVGRENILGLISNFKTFINTQCRGKNKN